MFKKALSALLLLFLALASFCKISFADEVIPFNKSFFAYNEPSFTSAKGNGGAQYGPQKALTVKEKRSDGWWKIGTWEGDKWINTDGEKKKIEKPYITFAEPKFTSPKGNNGNVIAPQVVTVIDGQEDGWLKIQTNEGDKWIFLNSEAVKVDKNFYAYNEPSFTSEKASGGNQYVPQKSLVVKEKRTNGWWKVATYEGDKWVNLDGELQAFDKPFLAFYEPSFSSQKGNMEIPYSSNTTVRVIDGNTKGWLKFQSWEGDKWMYPGVAETVAVNKNFYVYNEPSFTSAKGSIYGPQKFLAVMEKRQDGWWKIVTANEGLKWVALNGAKMDISNNLYYAYNEPSYSSDFANGGIPYGPQTVKVLEEIPNGWMKIATWEGDKWINLIGEKVCKKINRNVQRASISPAALNDNENQFNANSDNVNVVSFSNSIDLSWNKRENVAKYKLYKLSNEEQWEEVWNGVGTKYTLANLEPSNAYTLKLVSYDSNDGTLSENKINAFTLRGENQKAEYKKALLSPSNSNLARSATNINKVAYPMTDAYINTVESADMVKVMWGNVPTDDNSYEVYRDGKYVTFTNKTEFVDRKSSSVQKANISYASTADDPYRKYYDIKSTKQVPSSNVEEKVNVLKESGLNPTTEQIAELGCEEKNLGTYVDDWSSKEKAAQAISKSQASAPSQQGFIYRYQTFIPTSREWSPIKWFASLESFEGDGRGFDYFSDRYRTRLDVRVTWSMGWVDNSPAKFNVTKSTGLTTGYLKDGTPVNGKANAENDLNVKIESATPYQAKFSMKTASANPLVSGAPDIDAYAYVIVNRNGSGATAGFHDRAPNHEFYRGLYSGRPVYNPEILHRSELHGFWKFWALSGISTAEFVTVTPPLFAGS
ncbi:DUF3238 domain-containing protein [Bacillus cereus]|uniref:Fibronectin type-III domain-containing protein n=1 Tax=Bacillus cereus (strain VD146) TaxID=1053236 RepID=R8MPB0_BACCX|nr:DUF3238 domain-containing protein [Bacillus cereus]EOP36205.1 hypothetical protein IK1_02952 [Bacillus cereus VD146]